MRSIELYTIIALLTRRSFQIGHRDGLPDFDLIFQPNRIDWRREIDPPYLTDPLKEGYLLLTSIFV